MRKLKTIRSHVGHARWFFECEHEADNPDYCLTVGFLPHHKLPAESRYCYSPAYRVYRWNSKNAMILETSHKIYEVWEIDASAMYETEERATEEYIRSLRPLPMSGPIRHAGH